MVMLLCWLIENGFDLFGDFFDCVLGGDGNEEIFVVVEVNQGCGFFVVNFQVIVDYFFVVVGVIVG